MMTEPGNKLVIVTPVYEDRLASSQLFRELAAQFDGRVYIVAVEDGSVREPLEPGAIGSAGLSGVIIRLRRNVGHQRAIAVGVSYAARHLRDSTVVVMDCDGEDLPSTIPSLLSRLTSENVDCVAAQRKSRVETLRFRAFYLVYKWLFKMLSGRRIDFGNFMALKPTAIKRLAAMQELWLHVASCMIVSRLRLDTCALDRGPRYAGQSKMNFVGLALHGFKALMVCAEDVLVRVGTACALMAALSLFAGIGATTLKLIGFATPGWFSVALGILLLVFLQTGTLTLMTLMLTGVVRGGLVPAIAFEDFIDECIYEAPGKI